jgi:RNA polymerase sigma-70 factor (ECF subfamily)
MDSTRLSLLMRANDGSTLAWDEMVNLYRPLIYGWLRRHDVVHHDAEELTQDVLSVLVKELPRFSHSGNKGAFRSWLRRTTVNRALGFWRAGKVRPAATGETRFIRMCEQLEDGDSELTRNWDREHDQHVLSQLLQKMATQFSHTTYEAFRRLVFEDASAEAVAKDLNLTLGAVYSAKSRVLRQLRREASGLVDDSLR